MSQSQKAGDQASNIAVDRVTTKQISLSDASGKTKGTAMTTHGGSALWLDSGDGETIAVVSFKDQVGIGIYDRRSLKEGGGMPLALLVGDDGRPLIQFRHSDGNCRHLAIEDLYNHLQTTNPSLLAVPPVKPFMPTPPSELSQ